jgi:hypothetical protein
MSQADERWQPSYLAYRKHIPNLFGISTLAILGPILAHSSVTTSQNSRANTLEKSALKI